MADRGRQQPAGPARGQVAGRWREALDYALMWGIRHTPLPWPVKHWIIRLATARTVVAGAALIPDGEGRVLVLRTRYSGRWIPPGGIVHPGEDPLAGTRRECREELGQEIDVQRLVGLYSLTGTHELFVVFRCGPLAGPPRLGPEHEVFRYVPRPDLPWWLRAMADDAWNDEAATPVVRTLLGST
jgi:8-oxo-dGTP diphosphatase